MHRWKGRLAVVTGASSGIGAAIAELLARRGMSVIGGARSMDKLQELQKRLKDSGADGVLHPHFLDVRKDSSILELFKFADSLGHVSVVVNNAGVSPDAPLLTGATEVWREMLEVNVLAYAVCAREAYSRMVANKTNDGHIININSVSGHLVSHTPGTPNLHFYEATKFAVTAMTEGLRQELHTTDTYIRVSQVSPGWVQTNIMSRFYNDEGKGQQTMKDMGTKLDASDIANAVEFILSAPPMMEVGDVVVRGLKEH